jgi:hypothetical protein
MELDTAARLRNAFFRLVSSGTGDDALSDFGEAENEVVDTFLTRGARSAQQWMLENGYKGWRRREAVEFTEDSFGIKRFALPADFLRAYGDRVRAALVKPDGSRWGREADEDETGDGYFVEGGDLCLTRKANPPTTLYLDMHYLHPAFGANVVIDFPLAARALIVAFAADLAKEDAWLPAGPEMEMKIARALFRAKEEARKLARQTKSQRQMRKPRRLGNRW